MKIIDKCISATNLTLVFDTSLANVSNIKVYVDAAENYEKNLANNKHDICYNAPVVVDTSVLVTLPSDTSALIIVTAVLGDQICTTMFLNRYMLFKAQNKYLIAYDVKANDACEGCNEKQLRTELLAILLRTRLLNYAYENELVNDAVQFFVDLSRVLNFKDVLFESIPSFYNDLDSYTNALL